MLERTKTIFSELLEQLLHGVVWLVPGLVALVAILLVSTGVALGVRAGLRRFLKRIDFDRRMVELGLAPAAVTEVPGGPTQFAAQVGFYLVLLLGRLVGLSAFDTAATRGLAVQLAGYLPHVVIALVVFVLGAAAARFAERNVLIGAVNMGLQSARLVALGVRWLVLVFAAAMALAQLGVGGAIVTLGFGILFGGIVLALALAVGLGAKDLVARSLEKRFTPGEADHAEKPPEPARPKPPEDVQHL